MADDDFELWLGRIGTDPSFRGAVRRAVNLAGGAHIGRRTGRFTGARSGRGSATGSLLAAKRWRTGRRARRVVVKASVVRLAGKGAKAASAHVRYLQRDGTTREGERGHFYGADADRVDAGAFLERGAGDRHQFRVILSAEDGAEYADLKPLVRRWMAQVSEDLGTKLEWVAVDHFDTGQPHTHVLLRGKDDRGKDLVIARDYIAQGLRERAAELVNIDLGPRSDREIEAADRREVRQERLTGIDRRLLRAANADRLVRALHADPREQSLRAGRLAALTRMGLAARAGRGQWRLAEALEPMLKDMGRRGDIIATLDHAARTQRLAVLPASFAIFAPGDREAPPVVGRVADRGLAEHDAGRSYLIVDGIDGRAHYVDLGTDIEVLGTVARDAIVRVTPVAEDLREVDRTIVAVAAAHGGFYSADLHTLHDPSASERFIAAHVRRLEAMRRLARTAERDPDGLWPIAADHIEKVRAYEKTRAAERPVSVEVLTDRPLEELVRHDGITALDEDPDLRDGSRLGGGFGRNVIAALAARRQWMTEQGLTDLPAATEILRRREMARVAAGVARELGLEPVGIGPDGRVSGTYRQSVRVGAMRMAVIEDRGGFALVPWRPALERHLGRDVTGTVRGRDVDWSFGRQRRGPER